MTLAPIILKSPVNKKSRRYFSIVPPVIDYSKIFTSKYAMILNISVDHIERHRNLKNYVN